MANTVTIPGVGSYTTELQMQALITQTFWNTYPEERQMLHANDNNSHNRIEGAAKKAIGVIKGASDLELVVHGSVIFIELKLPGEVQLPEQITFQKKVESRGHLYIIIYSFVEFFKFIDNIWNTGN